MNGSEDQTGQGESRDGGQAQGSNGGGGEATDQAQGAQDTASGVTGGGQQGDDTPDESDGDSESYSYSDSDSTTTTMEEKGNEGLLGGLLGLDLLPSPESYTRTVESDDSESSSDPGEDSESGGEQADSDGG